MCEEVSLFFNCRPALKSVYFLEIQPSLCLASRLYEGLERACAELCELHRAKNTVSESQTGAKAPGRGPETLAHTCRTWSNIQFSNTERRTCLF